MCQAGLQLGHTQATRTTARGAWCINPSGRKSLARTERASCNCSNCGPTCSVADNASKRAWTAACRSTCAAIACPASRRGKSDTASGSVRIPQMHEPDTQTSSNTHQRGTSGTVGADATRGRGVGRSEEETKETSCMGGMEASDSNPYTCGTNQSSTSTLSSVHAENTVDPGCHTAVISGEVLIPRQLPTSQRLATTCWWK